MHIVCHYVVGLQYITDKRSTEVRVCDVTKMVASRLRGR